MTIMTYNYTDDLKHIPTELTGVKMEFDRYETTKCYMRVSGTDALLIDIPENFIAVNSPEIFLVSVKDAMIYAFQFSNDRNFTLKNALTVLNKLNIHIDVIFADHSKTDVIDFLAKMYVDISFNFKDVVDAAQFLMQNSKTNGDL